MSATQSPLADAILAAARECLETPFRHQGRIVGLALDCAGVVIHVMERLGLGYHEMRGYPRHPYAGMLEQVLDDQPNLVCIPREEVAPGDVLLMRFSGDPQHLAIYAGSTIIHAYEHSGKCCEHRMADVWRSRIVRVYRIGGEV